jgi:type VII secretion integral membrane protein EccD
MEERTQLRTPAPVRLRFVLDGKTTDMAMPANVAMMEVLPAILPILDPNAADAGVGHNGWIVRRTTGPPLDDERTPAELNLLDGETIYISPRSPEPPAIKFDDLVDGVAQQVRDGSGSWTPQRATAMWAAFAAAILMLTIPVLALGGPHEARAAAALSLSFALLIMGGMASRGAARPAIGSVLAGVGAVCASAAGWFALAWAVPGAAWTSQAAAAAIAGLAALSVGLALVADSSLLFVGAMTFLLVLVFPALVSAAGELSVQSSASIGLAVSLIVNMMLPLFAFRLGGMRLPLLPGNTKELAEDIEPIPYEVVVSRGTATVQYLASLTIGLGAAQLLLIPPLVMAGGSWTILLAFAAAMWLLLRSRHVLTTVQRWFVVAPALGLIAGAATRWAADHDFLVRVTVFVPLLAGIGGALAVAGSVLPGRRLAPYWGRAAEIAETFTAVAILPILGAVLNVYEVVRAWTGG